MSDETTRKITAIIVAHGESFLGEDGVDEAVCEAAAKEIAAKLEAGGDIIILDAHNVPHRFAVCSDRDCAKLFNACNLERLEGQLADEEIDGLPIYAGKCPYCKEPAKYLNDHENNVARSAFKMADKMSNNINTLSSSTERIAGQAFAAGLARQHRTLQQGFFRSVLYSIVRKFAEMKKNGETDMRNEASCELSVKLLKLFEDSHLPLI